MPSARYESRPSDAITQLQSLKRELKVYRKESQRWQDDFESIANEVESLGTEPQYQSVAELVDEIFTRLLRDVVEGGTSRMEETVSAVTARLETTPEEKRALIRRGLKLKWNFALLYRKGLKLDAQQEKLRERMQSVRAFVLVATARGISLEDHAYIMALLLDVKEEIDELYDISKRLESAQRQFGKRAR